MAQSSHHHDVPWCTIGDIQILYHTSITMNTSVSYDERTVFGSHGAYAVWTGTAPRTYSVSANLVAANSSEVNFNMDQVRTAYSWTQQSPPKCKDIKVPSGAAYLFNTEVRIESFDATIPENTHLSNVAPGSDMAAGAPIQIDFSLGLKECKAI